MATNYPVSLDDGTNIPNPAAGNFLNSPDHASLHGNTGDGLKAVEAKLGTGASTPVANRIMFGNGTGTSAWTQLTSANLAASLSDETGTGLAVFATSPTLTTPKVDTINESTPGNGTTVGGVNIKSGALNTNNSVVTANITNASVTANKLATGAGAAYVATSESTTSTSYADLATVTDTVTVTIGANGLALVSVGSYASNNTADAFSWTSFAVSGATTLSASDSYAQMFQTQGANHNQRATATTLLTGLTAGSTTFKMKYKVATGGSGAGAGTFVDRRISVVPL